jgi:hypothetical protein
VIGHLNDDVHHRGHFSIFPIFQFSNFPILQMEELGQTRDFTWDTLAKHVFVVAKATTGGGGGGAGRVGAWATAQAGGQTISRPRANRSN